MIERRNAQDRGHAEHGWLQSHHSFSFADYDDPQHRGFGPLRVINEDFVAAGSGFGTHPHRDMEIITYVLSGELTHQDDMGNGSVIRPGDVQKMSAGTGVRHSEFNHGTQSVHLLQIWIVPEQRGVTPDYQQVSIPAAQKRGQLTLLAGPMGSGAAVSLHQDALLYAGNFSGDEQLTKTLSPQRWVYVHLAEGELTVNGQRLQAGDALKLTAETSLHLTQGHQADVLVFDMAA